MSSAVEEFAAYHAKYKARKVTELWITMVWACAGTAPRGVLPKRSCAIHIDDITVRWSGMTRQAVHCTNRTQNTVTVHHGYCSFHGTEYQYCGLSASIFRDTVQGKTVQYRKRSEPQAQRAFNICRESLCWYSAYPLFPTAVHSSKLLQRT